MPDWVQNKLEIFNNKEEVLKAIEGDETAFDFEKVIPIPTKLKIMRGDFVHKIRNKRSIIEVIEEIKGLQEDNREEVFLNLMKAIRNQYLYGYTDWHDWCIGNWGTKWNAFETEIRDGCLYFQTAWGAPLNVIKELSKKYPDTEFKLTYASEDYGRNCGRIIYLAGEITEEIDENNSNDCMKFVFELWPNSREYFEKVDEGYRTL